MKSLLLAVPTVLARVAVVAVPMVLATGCGATSEPATSSPSPMTSGSGSVPATSAPVASVPDGWQDAAAMDPRTPVPLTPMMAEHQKANMRDHLQSVSAIVSALPTDDWAAIAAAADRLGSSPQTTMMCQHMGAGAPGFTERALAFHATADGIGVAARAKDHAGVVKALGDTLAACTGCHDAYRQEILTDAEYTEATGGPPPTHGMP